jgi:hypothetical protein
MAWMSCRACPATHGAEETARTFGWRLNPRVNLTGRERDKAWNKRRGVRGRLEGGIVVNKCEASEAKEDELPER